MVRIDYLPTLAMYWSFPQKKSMTKVLPVRSADFSVNVHINDSSEE